MQGNNRIKSVFAYTTIGLQLAITLLIFVYGGYKLDRYYKTEPWFLVGGVFVGMGLGFYGLFKEVGMLEKKKVHTEKRKKAKWL